METLDLARAATSVDQGEVTQRPRLLSDSGPYYLLHHLATYLETHGLPHTSCAPYHPMSDDVHQLDNTPERVYYSNSIMNIRICLQQPIDPR